MTSEDTPPPDGALTWLVRSGAGEVETVGFVRSDRSGALILGGPTGTHLTGHGEGWRGKWEELAGEGFVPVARARAAGAIPPSWRPPRLARRERRLLAAHVGSRPRRWWRGSLLNRLPRGWRGRGASDAAWRQEHAGAEAAEIERFLRLFCFSFLLRDSDRRFLFPADRPAEIYSANYGDPRAPRPDTLEWAHLADDLEAEYEVDLGAELTSLSLGEIFARLSSARGRGARRRRPASEAEEVEEAADERTE